MRQSSRLILPRSSGTPRSRDVQILLRWPIIIMLSLVPRYVFKVVTSVHTDQNRLSSLSATQRRHTTLSTAWRAEVFQPSVQFGTHRSSNLYHLGPYITFDRPITQFRSPCIVTYKQQIRRCSSIFDILDLAHHIHLSKSAQRSSLPSATTLLWRLDRRQTRLMPRKFMEGYKKRQNMAFGSRDMGHRFFALQAQGEYCLHVYRDSSQNECYITSSSLCYWYLLRQLCCAP